SSLLAAMATTSTNPSRRTASMWCAPTKPGPTSPIPIRFMLIARPKPSASARVTGDRAPADASPRLRPLRQRLLRKRHALPDFLDGGPGAAVLVFDVGANRPLLFLQELERFANRRVALAPRHVVALVLLPILQVQVGDVGVMLRDVRERVE